MDENKMGDVLDLALLINDCDQAVKFYNEKPGLAGTQAIIDLYGAVARLARIISYHAAKVQP